MKKIVLGSLIGGAVLLGGGAVTTAVLLTKAVDAGKKAVKTLKGFIPSGGSSPMKLWDDKKKINYVAMGGSYSAGFNGRLYGTKELNGETNYLSFADFLASDLKNAKKLSEYHNFAKSGDSLSEQKKLLLRNQNSYNTIKDADLITVGVGIADVVHQANLLNIPIKTSLRKVFNNVKGKIVEGNSFRKRIFSSGDRTRSQSEDPSEGMSGPEINNMLKKSVDIIDDVVNNNDYSQLFTMNEDFKNKFIPILSRDITQFIHDLHLVAPNAQIIVLGLPMPFAQFPNEVLNKRIDSLGGMSLREVYRKTLGAMEKTARATVGGRSEYVTFKRVDDLRIRRLTSDEERDRRPVNRKFSNYIKTNWEDSNHWIRNAMPNIADIHPSIFGHQLIGNALFDIVAPSLGIDVKEKFYTYTTPFDGIYEGAIPADEQEFKRLSMNEIGLWERIDENPGLKSYATNIVRAILGGDAESGRSTFKKVIPYLQQIEDFQPLLNILDRKSIEPMIKRIIESEGGNIVSNTLRELKKEENKIDVSFFIDNIKKIITQIRSFSDKSKLVDVVVDLAMDNSLPSYKLRKTLNNIEAKYYDKGTHFKSINNFLTNGLGIDLDKSPHGWINRFINAYNEAIEHYGISAIMTKYSENDRATLLSKMETYKNEFEATPFSPSDSELRRLYNKHKKRIEDDFGITIAPKQDIILRDIKPFNNYWEMFAKHSDFSGITKLIDLGLKFI